MSHTPEPWSVSHACTEPNTGIVLLSAADYARAMVCVNACAGVPQDALDGGWTAAGLSSYAKRLAADVALLKAQRDELLAALKLAECVYRKNVVLIGEPSSVLDAMQIAISNAENNTNKDKPA